MKNSVCSGASVMSAALIIGVVRAINEFMLPWIPLTFVKFSAGTICGINAPTAGVCTPCPSERTSAHTNSIT